MVSFGNGRTATGPVPTTIFFSPGTFTVTLTAKDEYGATNRPRFLVTISTPAGNRAPTAVISPPSCLGLSCNVSGATSVDPDTGDVLTYAWTFGDGATSTSASPSGPMRQPGRTPSR